MPTDNVLPFQPLSKTDAAHQRYQWYEQIDTDGLVDLVGYANRIAQQNFKVSYNWLARCFKKSPRTVKRKINILVDRVHLRIKKSGRDDGTINEYEMIQWS